MGLPELFGVRSHEELMEYMREKPDEPRVMELQELMDALGRKDEGTVSDEAI